MRESSDQPLLAPQWLRTMPESDNFVRQLDGWISSQPDRLHRITALWALAQAPIEPSSRSARIAAIFAPSPIRTSKPDIEIARRVLVEALRSNA